MANNGIKIEFDIEQSLKSAAHQRPAISKLHQPQSFAFAEHFVVKLLLNHSDPKIRKWYRTRLEQMEDVELIRSLSPADAAEKLIALMAIGEGQTVSNKLEKEHYKEQKKKFEQWQKHLAEIEGKLQQFQDLKKKMEFQEKQLEEEIEKKRSQLDSKVTTLDAVEQEIAAVKNRLKVARENRVKILGRGLNP